MNQVNQPLGASADEPVFTVVPYMYRDGGNHKVQRRIVLRGLVTDAQILELMDVFNGDVSFIPGALDGFHIGELQSHWPSFPCEDDHPWHELLLDSREVSRFNPTKDEVMDASAFVAALLSLQASDGWDEEGARRRLGIEGELHV